MTLRPLLLRHSQNFDKIDSFLLTVLCTFNLRLVSMGIALRNHFVFAKTTDQIIPENLLIVYQLVLFSSTRQVLPNL